MATYTFHAVIEGAGGCLALIMACFWWLSGKGSNIKSPLFWPVARDNLSANASNSSNGGIFGFRVISVFNLFPTTTLPEKLILLITDLPIKFITLINLK